MYNLAAVLFDQQRFDEAEQLDRRVLEARRRQLGEDHIDVAATMSNLALVLQQQHRLPESEEMYRRSLEIIASSLDRNTPTLRW
jgi:tetratricopeptide (TPR) repeat protein